MVLCTLYPQLCAFSFTYARLFTPLYILIDILNYINIQV